MRAPEFWQRGSASPWPRLLTPAAWIWQGASWLRWRLATPKRAPIPVVCIGNLVAGGAGKTPTAIAVARRLLHKGRKVHFLTRGYGGSLRGPLQVDVAKHDARAVGDEALLLAAVAPTWVARNRYRGALAAAAAGAEVLVMDDGLQNPGLAKTLSLLVIDAGFGIGNNRIIPAGPLREPVRTGLARADAVVLIGDLKPDASPELTRRTMSGKPLLRAWLVPDTATAPFAGKPVVAFAGIGRPQKFFDTLAAINCKTVATRSFPDHHFYQPDEIMQLAQAADRAGASLVTTAKDWVRLPAAARPMVQVLRVDLEFAEEGAIDMLLRRLPRVQA